METCLNRVEAFWQELEARHRPPLTWAMQQDHFLVSKRIKPLPSLHRDSSFVLNRSEAGEHSTPR